MAVFAVNRRNPHKTNGGGIEDTAAVCFVGANGLLEPKIRDYSCFFMQIKSPTSPHRLVWKLRPISPFILLLFCCLQQITLAQNSLDENALRSITSLQRYRFVHDLHLESLDSATFLAMYHPILDIAEAKKDKRTSWLLHFNYFLQRKILKLTLESTFGLLTELETTAKSNGFEVEQIVAHHYAVFEKYNAKQLPHVQAYVAILHEFERMKELGLEKFSDYNIARILLHSGSFMYQLEDFGKALDYLLAAEPFLEQNERGLQTCFLVLNHIQSIYQQQKEYPKGIEYAKKILNLAQRFQTGTLETRKMCGEWEGIASIDIASMLVGQQRFAESEPYADKGYKLVKASNKSGYQTEYEALQVLAPTKLELGKLEEAANLLQRMNKIYQEVGKEDYFYFKNIRFFEAYAKYYERKGDYAAAMHYTNLAKPLKDSLDRRNDARKLEQIKQRLDAEKYTEKLHLVESEKQLQMLLRNAALVIMLLVGALAFGNYHRLQYKRRQALKELEAAQNELATFTQNLREKSELAENLRLENERLANAGERSEYLEKLSRSTILTEEDWAQFRNVFEKVHPEFISLLKEKYPDLTPAETRLLVLEKLDLNLQEMANMLGVSKNTIHQTRYRLKKKMDSSATA